VISHVLGVVGGATAVGAVITWLALFRGASAPVNTRRIALAAALVCAVGVFEVGIAVWVLQRPFLAVNLVYTQLMVLVPTTGLALLVASRFPRTVDGVVVPRVTRGAPWWAGCGLLLAPVGVVGTFVEPYRLVTESALVPIAAERAWPTPVTIGVLSDIQCVSVTDRERDAVARVLAANADLIVLPGDLQQVGFDRRDEIAGALRELLAPLHAPLGVWYVEGDTEDCAQARYLLAGTPVRVLEDEIVRLEDAGRHVTLAGVTLNAKTARSRAVVEELETLDGTDDVRILLTHRPDVIRALRRDTRVDLVVAGHTHGGQVQLPWIGPLVTLSSVPRAVAAGGLHDLEGRRVYVSRGIGWEQGWAPRVRFSCPPEVSLLTLVRRDR